MSCLCSCVFLHTSSFLAHVPLRLPLTLVLLLEWSRTTQLLASNRDLEHLVTHEPLQQPFRSSVRTWGRRSAGSAPPLVDSRLPALKAASEPIPGMPAAKAAGGLLSRAWRKLDRFLSGDQRSCKRTCVRWQLVGRSLIAKTSLPARGRPVAVDLCPEPKVIYSFASQRDVAQWRVFVDAAFGGLSSAQFTQAEDGQKVRCGSVPPRVQDAAEAAGQD